MVWTRPREKMALDESTQGALDANPLRKAAARCWVLLLARIYECIAPAMSALRQAHAYHRVHPGSADDREDSRARRRGSTGAESAPRPRPTARGVGRHAGRRHNRLADIDQTAGTTDGDWDVTGSQQ